MTPPYLSLDEIKMFILSLYLVSHICCHVLQGSQDAAHPLHVLLHLHLAIVIGDPELGLLVFHIWVLSRRRFRMMVTSECRDLKQLQQLQHLCCHFQAVS